MRAFESSLTVILLLTGVPAVAQTPADTVASCDAWLSNKVKGLSLAINPKAIERLKAAGVSVEPSRRMRASGYPWEHEIQIALPPSYGKSDRKYPVLWVTDGSFFLSAALEVATACAGKTVPEMIVVAIGAPPEAKAEVGTRRGYDFSPNENSAFEGFGSAVHKALIDSGLKKLAAEGKPFTIRVGGAPQFLPFLVDEVRGQLGRDYRMADDDTLFGHSGGGLFCGYALVARPTAFKRYICGSPSLAAGDYEVFRIEERYAQANRDLAASVFFGAGEAEILSGSTWGIVSSMVRLEEILKSRNYPSLKLSTRIFPDENHVSVIPLVLSWGLRAVWQKDFPAREP
jgi:predicted alpha/beta superfamily hydrolase